MELKKQAVKYSQKIGNAFTQITLDDDYIIPDSKPDVVKVIHTAGNLVFEEPKVVNQSAWLKGKLDFTVLYRSDRGTDKVDVLKGSIPFQEKLAMEGVDELDPITLEWNLEDLSVVIINSRKLGIRAIADITAFSDLEKEELIPIGVCEEEKYQQKKTERTIANLITSKKDVFRVRNEIALPSAKPNIYQLLWNSIQPRNIETTIGEGKIKITGEVQIGVLYRGEEENQIQWYETTMPISGEVECMGSQSGDIFWAKVDPVTMELEPRGDYDGEQRILGIELVFDVNLKVWREEQISILEDVFSLQSNVIPERKESSLQKLLIKNHAKIRMSEQIHMEREKEKILQICVYEGNVSVEHSEPQNDGIFVEGVLSVTILYVTPEDNFPVEQVSELIPFEQLVEVPGITKNTLYELDYGVDQIHVNLLDNAEFEIKAGISIWVLAMEKEKIDKIEEGKEEPFCMETLQKMPGLIGYIVKPEEQLWDIAKTYHTTVQDLMETNGKKTEKIKPGEKILVVKKMELK